MVSVLDSGMSDSDLDSGGGHYMHVVVGQDPFTSLHPGV